jgi:elongation factor Ts
VHDGSKTVAQAVEESGKKSGSALVLKAFVRMQLGEGIEKADNDFAAEVAKMSGTN